MVEELKRRTSNFFPNLDQVTNTSFSVFSPFSSDCLPQIPPITAEESYFTLKDSPGTRTPLVSTPSVITAPSFLEPNLVGQLAFLPPPLLSLSGTLSPYSNWGELPETPSVRPANARISYSAPNIFSGTYPDREMEVDLSHNLGLLVLDLDDPGPFRDPFSEDRHRSNLSSESQLVSQRLSIWSTALKEEGIDALQSSFGSASSYHLSLPSSLEKLHRTKNIYASKLHTPVFVPGKDSMASSGCKGGSIDPIGPRKSRSSGQIGPNQSSEKKVEVVENELHPKRAPKGIIVKLPKPQNRECPVPQADGESLSKLCNKLLLQNLHAREYPEDFCSTFYKRNKNGYMFIRESSSSLKVNSSGQKSWVTIKVKLGNHDQQKIKVDVKKLPEWKPINLNLASVPRKFGKREHRKKGARRE